MLILLSLNMEGLRHIDRVTELITIEKPDCLCLLEMPSTFIYTLVEFGYYPTFAPMMRDTSVSEGETLGVCIATKRPALSEIQYYDGSVTGILSFVPRDNGITSSYPVIFITLKHDDGYEYHIASTHVMVTPHGVENEAQTASVEKLITLLKNKPSHILCGDFNIPRGYNGNYNQIIARYQDTIPQKFTSSLDRTLHREGSRTDLNAPIFDVFMVDYIFSQPPYTVSDIRFQFGVSDHAAVLATISIQS